jgi:hypothetical protein
MFAAKRKAAYYGGGNPKDPLDSKNPRNVLKMFEEAEKRIKEQTEKMEQK